MPEGKIRLPKICNPPNITNPPQQQVWIIFGASSQMGRSLAKFCIESNDLIVAVGCKSGDTLESMPVWHNAVNTVCDVRCYSSVEKVISLALSYYNRINLVVNCVEYGVMGACEDQSEFELRKQQEINFMGTLHIIQVSLPYFRKQGAGKFIVYNTTPGALGTPGLGPFFASKYAVEGLLESMLYEVHQFNIKVSLLECGWLGEDSFDREKNAFRSLESVSSSFSLENFVIKPPSEPYSQQSSPALHAMRMVQLIGDKQPICIMKCSDLAWQLGHCSYPPFRLSLGSYAIECVRDRLRSLVEETEDWTNLHFPITPGESISGDESEERRGKRDSL
ncbi:putative short chain dehydrogenase reductase family protein [Erysiphe necator]|uniref:Putative short chain dehydrogenase reductase family protein n=1 Tax=Uncinula necator TaxID=52586 RepID=A0A0B1P7I6_UNCNE|nr:putative short chain dehydrogenase reductase family protein [Erysiphe necator]